MSSSPISSRKMLPLVGRFEATGTVVKSIGESAFFMAEHFAFEQGLGDSAQVDFDERRLAALAVLVDRFGDQLLARAAFAGNQYGRRGACDARSRVEHLRQQRRPADDAFAPEYRLRSAFRRAGLFFTLFVDLDRRSDRIQQCEVVPGFGYEVESPGPDAPGRPGRSIPRR